MKRMRILLIATMVLTGLLTSSPVRADEEGARFEVTVTNLTRGQTFTPVLVAAPPAGVVLKGPSRPMVVRGGETCERP